MTTQHITVTVNGEAHEADVEPRLPPRPLPARHLGLTGTHVGCDTSNCGACTVHVDGESAKSCTMLAVQADGREVKTIEGMADGATLHPLQQAFWDQHGLQCGFCTPGMIMQAAWLLEQNPDPSEAEIREGISGNLCRCTGYVNIVKAIQQAAGTLARGRVRPGRGRRDRRRPGSLGRTGRGRLSGERRHDDRRSAPRAPHQPRDRGHGPLRQAQGGPALHPRRRRVHRRRQPARPAVAGHRPQPVCPRDDQGHRRHRGAEGPGRRSRSSTGKDLEGYKLHWMPTLAGDMQMVPADRHGHVPEPGGRGGHRHVPLRRRRRRRRRPRRLRAAAGRHRPAQGARGGRARPAPGPRRGQAEQPHLALGIRRRRQGRRRPRRVRGPGQASTSTSRASTSPRSRRAAASPTGTRSAASSRCT